MTNNFEGYLAVTSFIIGLEQKLKVFWTGGEQGLQNKHQNLNWSKKIILKCMHVVTTVDTLTLWRLRAIQVDSPPPSAPTSGDLSRHNNS